MESIAQCPFLAAATGRNVPRVDPDTIPLSDIDVSDPAHFENDTIGLYFDRLRRDAPVHYRKNGKYGDFWSVSKYRDIMYVDSHHEIFSAETLTGITINDRPVELDRPSFIAMDPPTHDDRRKSVSPMVAPENLMRLEEGIRQRTAAVLDALPRNTPFDWVESVSIEITIQMLATLLDFPFEDRSRLTWWSDVAHMDVNSGGPIKTEAQRDAEMSKMFDVFAKMFHERAKLPPKPDLISMLAHSAATQQILSVPREFIGTMQTLIVGGNDTTRNSMTASVYFMNKYPAEMAKLRANPRLIASMVPEVIRFLTPVAHIKRVALCDTELNRQTIRKGDRVVMWYISGNRDAEVIERPDEFVIDRANPRNHLSFGFGLHRCVGNRLAELQLRVLWEEMLKRDLKIEVLEEPKRVFSNLIHGFTSMPVRIAA